MVQLQAGDAVSSMHKNKLKLVWLNSWSHVCRKPQLVILLSFRRLGLTNFFSNGSSCYEKENWNPPHFFVTDSSKPQLLSSSWEKKSSNILPFISSGTSSKCQQFEFCRKWSANFSTQLRKTNVLLKRKFNSTLVAHKSGGKRFLSTLSKSAKRWYKQ